MPSSKFQFRLRSIFIATFAMLLLATYCGQRWWSKVRERTIIASIPEAMVSYDENYGCGPALLRSIVGDDLFSSPQKGVVFCKPLRSETWSGLGKLRTLREIDVNEPTIGDPARQRIGDDDLQALANLDSLKRLSLTCCDLDAHALIHITDKLEFLSLNECGITDATCKTIAARFPALRELEITESVITDEGLAAICGLTNLERLTVGCFRTSVGGNEAWRLPMHVRGSPRLQAVCLGGRAEIELADLPHLLEIQRGVSAKTVRLVNLPELTSATIDGATLLVSALPRLTELTLVNSAEISPDQFDQCPNLRILRCPGPDPGSTAKLLARARFPEHLQELELCFLRKPGNLESLGELKDLRSLQIDYRLFFDDLRELRLPALSGPRSLKLVIVNFDQIIDDETETRLRKKCPPGIDLRLLFDPKL